MHENAEKHEISYGCGHSVLRVRSRSHAQDALAVNAAARRLCTACLAEHDEMRKGMISSSVQRNREAIARTKMSGSKKQIEWAGRIREKWLYTVKRTMPEHSLSQFSNARCGGISPEAVEQAITNVLSAP